MEAVFVWVSKVIPASTDRRRDVGVVRQTNPEAEPALMVPPFRLTVCVPNP